MKDNEIRGIILQWFYEHRYEHRKEGKITPTVVAKVAA